MYDNDYLEKILGEQYNMSNYFEDTYSNSSDDSSAKVIDKTPDYMQSSAEPAQNSTPNETVQEVSTTVETATIASNAEPKNAESTEPITPAQLNANLQNLNQQSTLNTANTQNPANNLQQTETTETDINEVHIHGGNVTFYPDVYRVVMPVVRIVTENNQDEITNDTINNMAREVYYAIEEDAIEQQANAIQVAAPAHNPNHNPNRRPHNKLLYDLIKILILQNLRRY